MFFYFFGNQNPKKKKTEPPQYTEIKTERPQVGKKYSRGVGYDVHKGYRVSEPPSTVGGGWNLRFP